METVARVGTKSLRLVRSYIPNKRNTMSEINGQGRKKRYIVKYLGQVLTDPLEYTKAHRIAVEENLDCVRTGYEPLAEVTIFDKDTLK